MERQRARLLVFSFLILTFFGLVFFRLIDLQLFKGKKYFQFSRLNTLREIPIPAMRGRILDRHGKVLADIRPSFVLLIHLTQVKEISTTLKTLTYLTGFNSEELQEKIRKGKNLPSLAPIPIEKNIPWDRVAQIRSRISRILVGAEPQLAMEGIDLSLQYERTYPLGDRVGALLGYVREVSEQGLKEWEKKEPGRVRAGDKVGVGGVEKKFDLLLRGLDGARQLYVNALGNEVDLDALGLGGLDKTIPPQRGEDLHLTVDADLVNAAYEGLADHVGTVVAIDPRNGEILAWVSKPSFDSSQLSGTIPPAIWKELQNNPDKPLLNRPIQAAYPPGSTFKIVTAIAALVERKTDFHERIHCPGYFLFGKRKWGCWNKKGHGSVNLEEALIYSCDVFFYKVGLRLGPDLLAKYAKLLGLGSKTEVLADYEREGLVPTENWKEQKRKQKWMASDSLGGAIGQGYHLVTPLQNALMVAQFANGGKKIIPHLVSNIEHRTSNIGNSIPNSDLWGLSKDQYETLRQALIEVVNRPGATGGRSKLPNILVAGKTGTAQVIGHESKGKVAKDVKTEDHAWFVAFAPAEKPEIALAVMVEHGGGGGAVAAPVAKRVLEEYFKDRTSDQRPVTSDLGARIKNSRRSLVAGPLSVVHPL